MTACLWLQSEVLFWKCKWIFVLMSSVLLYWFESEKHRLQTSIEIFHCKAFPRNILRTHTTVTYICQSYVWTCKRVHCAMRPGANLVPFYKERKQGKNCEGKVGKSKAKVWEKTLILQPPVPGFLWGWGLPGLIQQQLYNVFLPFNRLHQRTRVYSLQLQTVAVSNKSVFNCGCCERPWFS